MLAVGGTEKMHRTVLSCVLRGHGPGDAAAEVSMKKMLRNVEAVLDASGKRDNEKRGYAAHWWKNYLLLCDWLPNEEKIQIRGPAYEFLHKHVYGEAVKQAGKYLSTRRGWDARRKDWSWLRRCSKEVIQRSCEGFSLCKAFQVRHPPNVLCKHTLRTHSSSCV